MKKSILTISIFISLAIFFYPTSSNSNSTGSPGGKTGSPTDNSSCTGCHSLGNGTGSATITSNISSFGYIPNQFYTITAEVTEPGINKFGFEITSEEVNFGLKTGNWAITNSSETQFTNNSTAITHTAGGSSGSNSKSWSMEWQAPSSGTGDVTFYASFLATNANGSPLGDLYHAATYTVSEATITSTCNLLDKQNDFTFDCSKKIIESNTKTPISIFDINGKFILNTYNHSTNISHLNSGVYILRSPKKTEKIILN